MNDLGFEPAPALRTLDEDCMVDQILQWGYPREVRGGRESSARAEALATLDAWIGLGLGVARSATTGGRLFDPVEAMNLFILAGLEDDDDFLAERSLPTKRAMLLDFHPGETAAAAPPAAGLPPRRCRVNFTRTFSIPATRSAAPIRLRIPTPLEGDAVTDLALDPRLPEGSECRMEPGRLDVRAPPSAAPEISLGFHAEFMAHPTIAADTPLSGADRALYTRPKEGFIQVTPRIAALARTLTSDGETPERSVETFHDHLLDTVKFGGLHYHLQSAPPSEWPLMTGWANCQTGSALFCALCRAIDVPARMVNGYELYPDGAGNHYWSEVWLAGRGWVPFDLLAWFLSSGGRDPEWRGVFRGAVDYRMKTQVLPRLFTGASAVALPPRWRVVTRIAQGGMEARVEDSLTGVAAYRDVVDAVFV